MINPQKLKIGIFDSGLGGLTVFKSLAIKYRDSASFIYLGDLAHLPYGEKSKKSIIQYSQRIVDFFLTKKIDIIIVACNSASSVALEELKTDDTPIFGTIEPSVLSVTRRPHTKSVGIIGTDTTINSKAYNQSFLNYTENFSSQLNIHSAACPLFVPIVEKGWENTDIAYQIATKYLSHFKKVHLDSIILACTHYSMLLDTLKSVFNQLGHKNLHFIDSGDAIAHHLSSILLPSNKTNQILHINDEFYVTDTSHQFNELANRFLGADIPKIKVITL